MSNEEILEMIKDLVSEVDYDYYKEMFVYDDNPDQIQRLIDIVKKHLKKKK